MYMLWREQSLIRWGLDRYLGAEVCKGIEKYSEEDKIVAEAFLGLLVKIICIIQGWSISPLWMLTTQYVIVDVIAVVIGKRLITSTASLVTG